MVLLKGSRKRSGDFPVHTPLCCWLHLADDTDWVQISCCARITNSKGRTRRRGLIWFGYLSRLESPTETESGLNVCGELEAGRLAALGRLDAVIPNIVAVGSI